MNHDQTFRAVLTAVLLLILPIGIYHRLRSQATREKLDRWQEGLFILATLRPVGIALWLGLIAWMVDPRWMAWSSVSLPTWLRWTGVGMIAIACGLLLWTLRCLGKNLTDTVVTRQQHTLVIHGPYRWVRHPFYDSAALLAVAVSLIAANWFLFVTGVVLFCLFIIRTRTEEENLVARFGDSYRAYMNGPGAFCLELERPCVAPDTARSQRRRRVKRATGSRLSRTGCFNALPLLWPTESFFDKACRLKRISRSNLTSRLAHYY